MKLYNCCVRAAYSHRSSQQPRVNSHQLIYEPVVLSEHCAPVYIFHANSPATCARLPAPTRALFLIGCIAFCAFVVGADAAPVAFSHIVWLLYVFSSLFFVSYVVVVIATIAHSTQWRFCHIHIADSNASWTLCVRACVCLYFTALYSTLYIGSPPLLLTINLHRSRVAAHVIAVTWSCWDFQCCLLTSFIVL